MIESKTDTKIPCYHCGLPTKEGDPQIGEKRFCCNGCKTVYELLEAKDMCAYYDADAAGNKPEVTGSGLKFGFLDDDEVRSKLIEFSDGKISKANFYIPNMHCSSCIYLLENLYKINDAISQSTVNFLKRRLTVTWHEGQISLREVVELLTTIGYEPHISLHDIDNQVESDEDKRLKYQIGVAAFCFLNIMLFSFPEYFLSEGEQIDPLLNRVFAYIKLILALPVFYYSGNVYFASAWGSLRQRVINMDFPISLGIFTLFSWSAYEIISNTGAGYMDSLAGFIFFLLLGKIFQKRTYDALTFDRDYKSYFPVAVIKIENGKETSVTVKNLRKNDRILIHNGELIPADSVLMKGGAHIDYSFVTGESDPKSCAIGDLVYAGGRQIGGVIELEVVKEVSQSYLTRLWENDAFTKPHRNSITTFANRIAGWFTFAVLVIAFSAGIFWFFEDAGKAVNAFTAVLIVACPCALALATPFTLGSVLRIYGKNKFYLKNDEIVERLSRIRAIVFDKTGTLTESGRDDVQYTGNPLSEDEITALRSLTRHSTHPLSIKIYRSLQSETFVETTSYEELPGRGIKGTISGMVIRLGSSSWIKKGLTDNSTGSDDVGIGTRVYLEIDQQVKGYFSITNQYRNGLKNLLSELSGFFRLFLLSGDNDRESRNLEMLFPENSSLKFGQKPHDKLEEIERIKSLNYDVMMVGDGLNDAGALKAADVGIAISEDMTNFSPASDALLDADSLDKLFRFMLLSKRCMHIIIASFILSFLYNIVGLSFAFSGLLSPLVSAILMPLSSISVAVFTTLMTRLAANRLGL